MPTLTVDGRRYLLREQIRPAVHLAILLGCAQTWRWWNAWLLAGALQVVTVVYHLVIVRKNPAVLDARGTKHADVKKRDRVYLVFLGLFGAGAPVVAGLDAGAPGWTGAVPGIAAGGALLLLGFVGTTWAMAVNAHFEVGVRIQTDRGHRVVDDGPYRLVRHPGYAFGLLALGSVPLLLGSTWAWLPIGGLALTTLARTTFEDRTLRAELPGYQAYAQVVRYRLVPGVF